MAGTTKDSSVVTDHSTTPGARLGHRLIALEIRPGRTGFVVLEEKTTLWEWGVCRHDKKEGQVALAGRKIAGLLDLYSPAVLVVRRRNVASNRGGAILSSVIKNMKSDVKRRAIEYNTLSTAAVRQFFVHYGCTTKHEIATILAEWFEELAWKLPPKRKIWEGEHFNAVVFDAMATAMAFVANR